MYLLEFSTKTHCHDLEFNSLKELTHYLGKEFGIEFLDIEDVRKLYFEAVLSDIEWSGDVAFSTEQLNFKDFFNFNLGLQICNDRTLRDFFDGLIGVMCFYKNNGEPISSFVDLDDTLSIMVAFYNIFVECNYSIEIRKIENLDVEALED